MSKILLFPVLEDDFLRAVPLDIVLRHAKQAHLNHGQSVQGLATRGGLDVTELYCVLNDIKWSEGFKKSYGECLRVVVEKIIEYKYALIAGRL